VNACPPDIAQNNSCLTANWANQPTPFTYNITITKRRASTVLDRYNSTILDVLNFDDGEPVNYGPEDFFPIFDAVFTVNLAEPGWNISTQLAFLTKTWGYFSSRVDYTLQTASDDGLTKLRSLFAVPVLRFNNAQYGGPLPNDLSNSTVSLAKVSYRVCN
jgi:hypothetical protein